LLWRQAHSVSAYLLEHRSLVVRMLVEEHAGSEDAELFTQRADSACFGESGCPVPLLLRNGDAGQLHAGTTGVR
jgi:hypothetical protein